MKLQLDFNPEKSDVSLKHGDKLVLLGSCFSDSLAPKFENAGFETCSNPLGTLFHPVSIANAINDALEGNLQAKPVEDGEIWYDWRASNFIYGYSREELEMNIASALSRLKIALSNADVIVVTFGTAWGYEHKTVGLVGNCHARPQRMFLKSLAGFEGIVFEWERIIDKIRAINPTVEFVFTVSPVRHTRDGLIENNRSKSRLIQACENLEVHGAYFPSYEIVTDVLRDYRFYKSDLVHPNDAAIEYVWKYVKQFFLDEVTKNIVHGVEGVNARKRHRARHPHSEKTRKFVETTLQLQEKLTEETPAIFWK